MPSPYLGTAGLTQVSIVPPAELPAAAEAQVKGLLIWAPQLVPTLNGSKGFLGIAVGDKAIVVPEAKEKGEGDQQQHSMSFLALHHPLEEWEMG